MNPEKLKLSPVGHLRQSFVRLRRDERGLSTVEYVILLAVIVVGAVVTWNQIGTKFKSTLQEAESEFQNL